jgi:hypothetical protein
MRFDSQRLVGMPPKKGRRRPKKEFKGAAARNEIESDARKEAAVTPVQDPRDLHVTDTPKTESGPQPQPKKFKHRGTNDSTTQPIANEYKQSTSSGSMQANQGSTKPTPANNQA